MIEQNRLIALTNPKSPISEAYRVVRTNIQFSSADKQLKVMVITSSGPEEGKTTTISNLAIMFAHSHGKVLLIDADLRRPKVHKLFEVSNAVGLTNTLIKQGEYTDYISHTSMDNLDILSAGPIPPNPSELLSSNSMKELIDKVRNDYDIVFIDSPPVGTVTDSAILSTIVDGTILVTASAKVEIEAAKRAKELLCKVNANIIGVILNMLQKHEKGNYYYSYYGEEEYKSFNKRNEKFINWITNGVERLKCSISKCE